MLPELEIYNPSDSISTKKICEIVSKSKKPSYIRLDKSQQSILYSDKINFDSNFKIISRNSKNCIITTGIMTHKSIELSNILGRKNLNLDIVDLIKLKPINEKKLINCLKKYKNIFVIDENTFSGGISSILSEIFTKNNFKKQINFYCLKNTQDVGFYGNRDWLHKRNKLDIKSLITEITKELNN